MIRRFAREKRDPYYRAAKGLGLRARSAFKLLHVHASTRALADAVAAVDLCAAPGSWSQVLSAQVRENARRCGGQPAVVCVDLQAMAPIPGVTAIQGDITALSTVQQVVDAFRAASGDGRADAVVCDGAPDVTGDHDLDAFLHAALLTAAANVATELLRPGGSFVAKVFTGRAVPLTHSIMRHLFKAVLWVKPPSSRPRSAEAFLVGLSYAPPDGYVPSMQVPLYGTSAFSADAAWGGAHARNRTNFALVPLFAMGDFEHLTALPSSEEFTSTASDTPAAASAAPSASSVAAPPPVDEDKPALGTFRRCPPAARARLDAYTKLLTKLER